MGSAVRRIASLALDWRFECCSIEIFLLLTESLRNVSDEPPLATSQRPCGSLLFRDYPRRLNQKIYVSNLCLKTKKLTNQN